MALRLLQGTSGADQQGIKMNRSTLAVSDDNVMMRQILATHAPDGREVDVKPLLHIVQDILSRATLQPDAGLQSEKEDRAYNKNYAALDAISYTIDRISCEISCKALGGGDAHSTTLSIFNMLASYSWDAKLVLTMSAFGLNYGEFWLLAQISSTNQLAKAMATLKQLPFILEHTGALKPRFEALNNLIKVMLDVTSCVVEFKELPSMYISPDVPALTTALAHVPTAVYWTIRSVVACAAQITSLTTMGYEFVVSTSEAWELSTLAHKLQNIYELLRQQLEICYRHIEEKKNADAYQVLLNLFETIHIDNMKILKALIYARDETLPLVDGSTKTRVSIDVLRRKNVLLLISSLDISHEELSALEQIYNDSRMHANRLEMYEILWIPIVDPSIQWTDTMQARFLSLQNSMPWYSVHRPSLIQKVVIRFIKEVWHFTNKPILVVLDPQGKVVSPNALHMMWIWARSAFPFTSEREEALWRADTWTVELLVDGFDPTILNWIKEGKYIMLYGGDDIEWVRKFTGAARAVALAARVPLEMVYVGKSNKREQVRRVIATINAEKLSYSWQDLTMIWFFWTRIESMLFSKIQLGKMVEQDLVMQEIKKLLSYDKEEGWAVLSKGSNIVVNGHGAAFLPTWLEYDMWKQHIAEKGFELSLKEHYDRLHRIAQPCCRFDFPTTIGRIPGAMKCPECHRTMGKYITFRCCHDDGNPSESFY